MRGQGNNIEWSVFFGLLGLMGYAAIFLMVGLLVFVRAEQTKPVAEAVTAIAGLLYIALASNWRQSRVSIWGMRTLMRAPPLDMV